MRRVTSEAAGRVSAARPPRGKQPSSPVIKSITDKPPRPGHTLLEIRRSVFIQPTIADKRSKASPPRVCKPFYPREQVRSGRLRQQVTIVVDHGSVYGDPFPALSNSSFGPPTPFAAMRQARERLGCGSL